MSSSLTPYDSSIGSTETTDDRQQLQRSDLEVYRKGFLSWDLVSGGRRVFAVIAFCPLAATNHHLHQ